MGRDDAAVVTGGPIDDVRQGVRVTLEKRPFGVSGYGAHVVVTLAGELDQVNCAEMTEVLSKVLQPETSTVQIDAGGVTFLDSTALRSLLSFHRLAATGGVRVTIRPASDIVRRLLGIVRLEHLFDGSDVRGGASI